MAIYWSSGSQLDYSNVVSYKTAVTGQQETRNQNQGSSGFAPVAGLNSISHAIKRSGNIVICRFSACWEGNANTDEVRCYFTYDDNSGHGGAVGHASQSSSDQTRNNSVHAVGVLHLTILIVTPIKQNGFQQNQEHLKKSMQQLTQLFGLNVCLN